MILIIDNYDSFTYNLYQTVAQLTSDVQVIRNDQITVNEVKALSPAGIIVSPGPGRPENAGICVELIRNLAASIPLLGVCLGLQAMAIAFGGKVILAPQPIHGKVGRIFHQEKNLYHSLPQGFKAGRYHSLVVDRQNLPAELLVEAETEDGLIMGMKHARYPTYGVQFHPESILTHQGNTLLQNFVNICLG